MWLILFLNWNQTIQNWEEKTKWQKPIENGKKLLNQKKISKRWRSHQLQGSCLMVVGLQNSKKKKKLDKGSRFLFYFVTALLPWIQLSSESKRFSANEMTEEKYFLTYFRNLKMKFTWEMSEKKKFCKSQKETRIEY